MENLEKRKKMMDEQERREWAFREQEIEKYEILRNPYRFQNCSINPLPPNHLLDLHHVGLKTAVYSRF